MVRFLHGTNQTETSSRASSKAEIAQRDRKNGWGCPWHPLQLIAWFFLCFFAITYFGICVSYLPIEWRPAAYIIPGGLYVVHVIVHIMALSVDPADPHIRVGPSRQKNVFDRNAHAHVIENNHCHICEADVFPKSKHCSSCNKCVSDFDHHCKWLNTCVGGRNYKLFVGCISTAFAGSLLMAVVNLYLFISFFTNKNSLVKTQTGGQFKLFAPVSENTFVIFVGAIEGLHLVAIGLLGHLLCFHLYLIYLNISTYEFIVNSRERKVQSNDQEAGQSHGGTPISLQHFRNNKVRPIPEGMENGELSVDAPLPDNSSSSEEPPCETTVKVMNEVSSKLAKRSLSHESPSIQNDKDIITASERTECSKKPTIEYDDNVPASVASSSAESLREVKRPEILQADDKISSNIHRPYLSNLHDGGINQSNDVYRHQSMSNSNQSQRDARHISSASKYSTSNNFPIGASSLKPNSLPEECRGDFSNHGLSDSEGEELVPVEVKIPGKQPTMDEINDIHNENISSNEVVKKKKIKKHRSAKQEKEHFELKNERLKRTPELNELPPLVTKDGRPLPSLDSYTNENSAC